MLVSSLYFAWRSGRLGGGLQNLIGWFNSNFMLHYKKVEGLESHSGKSSTIELL